MGTTLTPEIEKVEIGWVNDDFCFDRYTVKVKYNNHTFELFKFYPRECLIVFYCDNRDGTVSLLTVPENNSNILDSNKTEWYGIGGKLNGLTLRMFSTFSKNT